MSYPAYRWYHTSWICARGCENWYFQKWNDPWLLHFAIIVFLYKLWSSAIKGHFCTFLVSSIILTSLSTDWTWLLFPDSSDLSWATGRLWSVIRRSCSEPCLWKPFHREYLTCSLVSPFLLSDYIIVHVAQFFNPESCTNFIIYKLCIPQILYKPLDFPFHIW